MPQLNPLHPTDADAYKHRDLGHAALWRHMLHRTFSEDLLESLLTETAPDLKWEKYTPGQREPSDLPAYFERVVRDSTRPQYFTPYTADDFSGFQLFKVKGLDAGFALKGSDIIAVHNNSTTKGIAGKLLDKAVEAGGTHLDHFDGKLSSIYARHFPEVYLTSPWDDQYAPEGWKYEPVDLSTSHFADAHAARPQDDEEMKPIRANYAAGKPHIIYRQKPGVDRTW